MVQFKVIGQSVPRIDAHEIVTGEAKYTVDIGLPNMLVGKILRSPLPHAKIVGINIEKAKSLRGVMAVVTGADTLKKRYGYRQGSEDEYGLAVGKVRYIGEQVAAVAALGEGFCGGGASLFKISF